MLIFNLLFGFTILVMVLLIPQIKKYLKKKYDFNFSPHRTPLINSPTHPKTQAEPKPNTASQETHEKPTSNSSNEEVIQQTTATKNDVEQRQKEHIRVVSSTSDEDELVSSVLTAENIDDDLSPTLSDETSNEKEEESRTENRSTKKAKNRPKAKVKEPPKPIEQLTFYILPKEQPGEIAQLQGNDLIDALLGQKTEGEIRFNEDLRCFTHYTRKNQAVYHIYQATDPVEFPQSLDLVKDLVTTGLMFNIQFPIEGGMPAFYAYNAYFRRTATQVANVLAYKIYDEELKEWTDKRLEATRKAMVTTTQGSLI